MAFKFCKRCGNKLELEDQFCDKCGAEQKKKTVATVVTGTATEEIASKDRQQKADETETNLPQEPERSVFSIRPSILIALVLVLLLAVSVAALSFHATPQMASFTIEVQSNTSWQGSYGSTGGMTSVDGSGNENFQVQGIIVSAVFQMQTGNYGDTLTVSIWQGSTVLSQQSTSAAYGVVSVTARS
jgi:hypothetical protein